MNYNCKLSLFFVFVGFLLPAFLYAQERIICDETCDTGDNTKVTMSDKGVAGYAVVSPVGRATVNPIVQAPRLQSLEGKTIAVVGVSFMSRVTHPEIKRLIERDYPTARVLLLDEVGTAGPYPAPGITRHAKDDFQRHQRTLSVCSWQRTTVYFSNHTAY